MNYALICHLLGRIALLLGSSMALSLPWTFSICGQVEQFDATSFWAILSAMAISGMLGGLLVYVGRGGTTQRLYRRETIAVVGLSWILATLLGALPYWFSGTCRGVDPQGNPVRMNIIDGLFESASGFSGTGATVLTDVEDPLLVPRAVLFWRSETHFLGGLGIMVLFVAILGLGSAGKALLVTEMPGPSQESEYARTRSAAWVFASLFLGLNGLLTILLLLQGVNLFDALCHSFGTIATGGFSTYNNSIEHFGSFGIEMTITLFMILACTNFNLLYYLVILKPKKLIADTEFRTYLAILFSVAVLVGYFGLRSGDFADFYESLRYGLFQVTSIMTNTGFGTADFDGWNHFSRAALVVLMFIGGCAGSTSCSVKVIRYILLAKILRVEVEKVFRPSLVRRVRVGGKVMDDPDLRKDVLVYFALVIVIFVIAFLVLVAVEPDHTWTSQGFHHRNKLTDCASAVAATLNGVGPGLGLVGESRNYSHLQSASKLVIIWLMLFGRLEIMVVLALFYPRFWTRR